MELHEIETSRLINELSRRGYGINLLYERESVLIALMDSEGISPVLSLEEQTEILENAIDSVVNEVDSLMQTAIVEEFENLKESSETQKS
jgi:hypothetical protein